MPDLGNPVTNKVSFGSIEMFFLLFTENWIGKRLKLFGKQLEARKVAVLILFLLLAQGGK